MPRDTDFDLCREALERAFDLCGNSQSEMARRVGVTQASVWKWLKAGRVPLRWVPAVVHAVDGAVTAHELRPDLPEFFPHPVDAA